MYGQIHVIVRKLVTEKFGQDAWNTILQKSGLDDLDHFLVFCHYDDAKTLALVAAASEVLSVPVSTVLEIFGEYFFKYCLEHGYDKMLRTLGNNFRTFIQNLDSLHSLLQMTYRDINAPSFRCEDIQTDGTLLLHYYSSRSGLYPIVTGLLRAIGRELFETELTSEVISIQKEQVTDDTVQDHVTFKITFQSQTHETIQPKRHSMMDIRTMTIPDNIIISPECFCSIFPYHIVFDKELRVRQCGQNIQKIPYLAQSIMTERLDQLFVLKHPQMHLTYDHILRFINSVYILETKDDLQKTLNLPPLLDENGESILLKKLTLKGQMIKLADGESIIYICSLRLASINELQERSLYLSDIPIYDVTRELVLLNQQRIAEIEVSKKLDETTMELKRTAKLLEIEKKKTDSLLYQMLPVKVADHLREGTPVEAEKFEEVTILFSDIVSFTKISAAVQPMQVVGMLNSLFSKFDELTSIHDVYKVETIGDAYMVAGGLPERNSVHARQVAHLALDMVKAANCVNSPVTNIPLQIRVGIHTGPVVAGVVGDKMPRYCLFGDTVNTASRMESHGLPGKIHCSASTYRAAKCEQFHFEVRGEMEIKGKGKMATYFLIGTQGKTSKKTTDVICSSRQSVRTEKKTKDSSVCNIL